MSPKRGAVRITVCLLRRAPRPPELDSPSRIFPIATAQARKKPLPHRELNCYAVWRGPTALARMRPHTDHPTWPEGNGPVPDSHPKLLVFRRFGTNPESPE